MSGVSIRLTSYTDLQNPKAVSAYLKIDIEPHFFNYIIENNDIFLITV